MADNGKNTDLRYHLVWCPKYRRKVLVGEFADRLRELLFECVENLGGEIFELSIEPDHVHLFGRFPHTFSVDQVVFRLK
ncbi:IS200/IS605 family transposase, partial [Candidatus Pacearchaeota archaeon]